MKRSTHPVDDGLADAATSPSHPAGAQPVPHKARAIRHRIELALASNRNSSLVTAPSTHLGIPERCCLPCLVDPGLPSSGIVTEFFRIDA
jgi:hypothetical protein